MSVGIAFDSKHMSVESLLIHVVSVKNVPKADEYQEDNHINKSGEEQKVNNDDSSNKFSGKPNIYDCQDGNDIKHDKE